MIAAGLLIAVAVAALIVSELAEWPIDKFAMPLVLAFGVGGGFLWGLAVRR